MRALIAGNWKMHGTGQALEEVRKVADAAAAIDCDLLLCPPATLLHRAVEASGGRLPIGAQDCHWERSGAFTGDISAEMLVDAGARAVIVGHSERRLYHAESDQQVEAKARAAQAVGLVTIICVGESEAERAAGQEMAVVGRQLSGSIPEGSSAQTCVVAYEPVWAIGSGRTPTREEILAMHGFIRTSLGRRLGGAGQAMRILYGGSVKPANAAQILGLPDVAGALVGGASLKADEFLAIARAAGQEINHGKPTLR
ncbi:MAG: triose-phosphate isomerase [Alphaproteobacteria bacterium]|nr:triose-phosphate isomerase [Alphaproteobacteria bacterium]